MGSWLNEKGMTLVELLLALALVALVLGGVFSVYWTGNQAFSRQNSRSDAQYAARRAMQDIVRDVRFSEQVAVEEGGTKLVLNLSTGTIEYYRGGDTLYRKTGGSPVPIAENITLLSFSDTVKPLSIKIEARVGGRQYLLSSSAVPRVLMASNITPAELFPDYVTDENVFVYGSHFSFSGNVVNGSEATIVVKGNLEGNEINGGATINVKNIYINGNVDFDGGSASLGSSSNTGTTYINGDLTLWDGKRHIYGDVYVAGDFRLKDAIIHGNVYVAGNVELGWTPEIKPGAHIYYTGTLTHPASMGSTITSKCIWQASVPSFTIPSYDIPPLKADAWYADHGYVSGGSLANGIKIFADSYSFKKSATYSNVVIVSKSDISLTGWMTLSGVLFAPHGKVNFAGGHFEGVVIARDGFHVSSGGSTINFKNISNYFADISDYPF